MLNAIAELLKANSQLLFDWRDRMSLGWQSESALMPSKARAIKIDSSSMIGLRAVIGGQLDRRAGRNSTHAKPLMKRSSEPRNTGVDSRSKLDVRERDHDQALLKRSLRKKAVLYEKLHRHGEATDAGDSGDNSDHEINEDYLVNFAAKRRAAAEHRKDKGTGESDGEVESSTAHKRRRKIDCDDDDDDDGYDGYDGYDDNVASSSSSLPVTASAANSGAAMKAGPLVSPGDSSSRISGPSSTSTVHTQWSRVLNSSAKAFLEEVRTELTSSPSAASGSGATATTSASAGTGGADRERKARLALLLERKAKKEWGTK